MLEGTQTWLNQSVLIALRTGNTENGLPTYAAGAVTPCIIEQSVKELVGKDGKATMASIAVTLDGSVTLTPRDKITLPDGSTPIILAVETVPGPDGLPYLTVVRA